MKSFTKGIKVIAVFMFLLCQAVTAQVWEEIGINLPAGDTASSNTEITFTNKDTGWLYTEFYRGETKYKKLYRTTNGGQNWNTITSDNDIVQYNTVLFSMEPDFFYMIKGSKALFTTDGGNTWDSISVENAYEGYSALYFFNEKRGITFYGNSWITTDGGKTWEKKGEIALPSDVYFNNDKVGWAVGSGLIAADVGYIAKTTDGGETWEYQDYHIPAFFLARFGIDFIDSLKGFIIGEALTKTTDGGKNWNRDYNIYGYDIGFLDNKYGWISSWGQILKTTNGGETWENQFNIIINYRLVNLMILKKDKIAYVLGFNPASNNATLLRADLSNITNIMENKEAIQNKFYLFQNYPNPFNPTTTISYSIPQSPLLRGLSLREAVRPGEDQAVAGGGVLTSLKVYDILGREITTLVNEEKKPGSYKVSFNAGEYNLTSGVYLARLSAGKFNNSIKLILQK